MSIPPLAALCLTHFDEVKGQSVIFYASTDDEGGLAIYPLRPLTVMDSNSSEAD